MVGELIALKECLNQISEIVNNCESIQVGNDSKWVKEQAKLTAYDDIVEVLGQEVSDE